jgi:hypothetical protein
MIKCGPYRPHINGHDKPCYRWRMLTGCLNMLNLDVQLFQRTSMIAPNKRKPVTLSVLLLNTICVSTAHDVCMKDSYPWHTEEWRQRIRQLLQTLKHNRKAPSHDIQINDYCPCKTDERLLPTAYRSMTAGHKTKTTNTPNVCDMWAAAQPSWNRETCVIAVLEHTA